MMLEELQRRNYSAITTRNYLRVVTEFAKYFGKSPDKLGPNELRTYQAYLLTERKLTPGTVVNRVAALRFFFFKTLKRHQFREFLPYPRDRRRLPIVLSQGGSLAADQWRRKPVSTDVADDTLRNRHATRRTRASQGRRRR
jgi:site-specific recombinase XerD